MTVERVAGLGITIGYTILILIAIQPGASLGIIDAVPWIAALLLFVSWSSWLLPDSSIARYAGGRIESLIRGGALAIQVFALFITGWWGTMALRVAAEGMSAYRIWLARQHLGMSFRIDDDEHGQHYIHCYQCGYDSYSAMDISQLYCGNCHKYHQGNDGAMT
jgi:hypothetical protein